jgi:hypothetical protein
MRYQGGCSIGSKMIREKLDQRLLFTKLQRLATLRQAFCDPSVESWMLYCCLEIRMGHCSALPVVASEVATYHVSSLLILKL